MGLRDEGLRESLPAQGLKQGGLRGSLRNLNSTGPDIPDSAVLRYKLDEGSGSTASDSVGSNDLGSISASWITNNWQGGAALEFSTDFAESASKVSEINNSNSFAIGLTIDPDSVTTGVICEQLDSDSTGFTIGLVSGEVAARDYNGAGASGSISTGSKQRVLAGYDGSSPIIYINTSEGTNSNISSNGSTGGNLAFGQQTQNDGSRPYHGSLDDVIVYDEAPSSPLATADYDVQPWT